MVGQGGARPVLPPVDVGPCGNGSVEKSFILETVFGLVVAAIAELSSLALLLRPAMVLLPLARFAALVFIVCAGGMLPKGIRPRSP